MTNRTSVTYSHRTTVSIDGIILYDCPVEIHDQSDLDNYHITWNDCTSLNFGGTDKRSIYFYPTPSRDLAEFMWKELNNDHSRTNKLRRCMIPGKRKALIRCPFGNACSRCPYGKDPAERQANIISFDQMTENAYEKEYTGESTSSTTEDSWLFNILIEQAQEALNRLDPRLMTILRRKYLQGYSIEEIAGELGCSVPRVYQLEKEALKQMREFLSE